MQIICEHCHAKGNIDDKWLGKKIKCPKCQKSFIANEAQGIKKATAAGGTSPKTVNQQPVPSVSESRPTQRCSQCNKTTPEDELVDFDGLPVCARCKSVYLQKMKEGVSDPDVDFEYGGFWIRVGAKVIDSIITGLVAGVIGFALGMLLFQLGSEPFVVGLMNQLVGFGLGVTYVTWFVGRFGATPGKMALGLKIVKPDGDDLTYMQAFGRFWGEMLSSIIMGIGYLMVAFDDEKRALHDRICTTRVVRTR